MLPTMEEVGVASKGPISRLPQGLDGAVRQSPRYRPRLPVSLRVERIWAGPYAPMRDVAFWANRVELTLLPIRVAWELCEAARRAMRKETSGD